MSHQDPNFDDAGDLEPPPKDQLDILLREWHQHHAERAMSARDRLMQKISSEHAEQETTAGVKVRECGD